MLSGTAAVAGHARGQGDADHMCWLLLIACNQLIYLSLTRELGLLGRVKGLFHPGTCCIL